MFELAESEDIEIDETRTTLIEERNEASEEELQVGISMSQAARKAINRHMR